MPSPATPRKPRPGILSVLILAVVACGLAALLWYLQGGAAVSQHLGRGADLIKAGKTEDALREWEEAVRLAPDNATAWELLADTYIRERRWSDAVRALRALTRVKPDTPEAHARLAACLVRVGELDEAWTEANEELKRSPDSVTALVIVAKLGKLKSEPSAQLSVLRRLVRLQPDQVPHLLMLASLLVTQNQLSEAESVTAHVLQLDPNNAEAHATRGVALHGAGASPEKLAQAEESLKRSLALRPDKSYTHFHLARVLLDRGKAQEAAQHLEAATSLQPDKPGIWYLLGIARRKAGDETGAGKALRQYESLRGADEKFNKLVMLGEQQPKDFEKQLEIGQAYLQRRRYREAHYYFMRALHLRPDDPRVRAELAKLQGLTDTGQGEADPGWSERSERTAITNENAKAK